MVDHARRRLRSLLFSASALAAFAVAGSALAQTAGVAAAAPIQVAAADEAPVETAGIVVEVTRTTRSAVALAGVEAQKILPGVSPLRAIQTLPGVTFTTADPWGNNEQNLALFVHGFSTQQLGYTMDNVPLGDQQYGNYNGLSVSRALTSENVGRVVLSSGAGNLGVASTSNLGGAIETFSRDPSDKQAVNIRQTLGSYKTTRSFLRVDTGEFLGGLGYVSFVHHDAKAWDFDGHQRGNQANLKYVRDDKRGKFTLYLDWSDKVEPNEDATSFGNQQTSAAANFTPYSRPFIYPDTDRCTSYLATNPNAPGTPPAQFGNNFSNCFSAAQRTDLLGYVKYEWKVTDDLTWSNQLYYHYNYGRGIVAGPINQAGLPGLFATYFPNLVVGANGQPVPVSQAAANANTPGTLRNIANLFGGTGNEVRTTEYRDNRMGLQSNFNWQLGQHQVEGGVWWEHNEPAQHRVWYPFTAANNDLTPYDEPGGPSVLTQYFTEFYTNDVQLHLQDQWRVMPTLLIQAGVKASLQTANGKVRVNQKNLPTVSTPVVNPSGELTSNEWFLPQAGAIWDATEHEQLFVNAQKNMRQFIPYGAGSNFFGFSPWSLGTQAAFDLFKSTVKPETSWTYELGARTRRELEAGFLTGIEGQASVYHVNFKNRLLNVAPFNFINPGPAILANVGGVTSNGVDLALTFHFGPHFQFYDGLSYNRSKYDSDYSSGTNASGAPVIVATGGKLVPLQPKWSNKFIFSTKWGPFSGQLSGDYIGRRMVTYLNDLSVKPTFVTGLQASYDFDLKETSVVRSLKLSGNVVNLGGVRGVSTAVVTGASGGYQAFPLAPRMGFVTLEATF
jgi:outer membrane receptor protein involved in Fe transport